MAKVQHGFPPYLKESSMLNFCVLPMANYFLVNVSQPISE